MLGSQNKEDDKKRTTNRVYSIYAKGSPTERIQSQWFNPAQTVGKPPYNIYDEKGPEARAQAALNKTVSNSLVKGKALLGNTADTYLGGAGSKQALNAVARGLDSVALDRKKQQSYLKYQRIKAMDPVGQTLSEPWIDTANITGAPESKVRPGQFQGLTTYDTKKQHGPILGPYAAESQPTSARQVAKSLNYPVEAPLSITQQIAEPIQQETKSMPRGTQQALEKLGRDTNVRVNSDGYSFEGSANDGSKFFAPTGKGDPVADKARALQHQQWLDRQSRPRSVIQRSPSIAVQRSPSIASSIAPPKTIGDLLRYNREMKAQKLRNAQANTEAKTSIAAFEASQSAKHQNELASTAYAKLRLDAEQNQASNVLSADKNDILRNYYDNTNKTNSAEVNEKIRASKAEQALKKSSTPSEIALREAQAELARQQGLTSIQSQDAQRMENDHKQRIITAQNELAANPTPENQTKLRALLGETTAQLTPFQQAQLAQKELDSKIKFISAFPMTRQKEALEQYELFRKKFNGDPTKMAALTAGQEDAEEEDYATQLFNNF